MAVTTTLENLPIDAVEQIAKYLTSSDLSNCCAVSYVWRMVFDNDIIWRNRFNRNITDYLKVAKCQVEPTFSLVESDTLQSVGSYRKDFLLESRLWQNWRSGRFKREEIDIRRDNSSSFKYYTQVDFLDNDHVLLHRNSKTEVWNISQEPNFILNIPFTFSGVWSNNSFKIFSNRLIVVQNNLVHIFSICLETKTSNIDQMFFFDNTEEFSSTQLMNVEVECECVICGTFLLGVVTADLGNLVFHVWDISNGKKLKEVTCPVLPSSPCFVKLKAVEKSQDKVIVILDIHAISSSYVFLFDLKKLEFIGQSKIHVQSCDFTLIDKYLFALSLPHLKIIDFDMNNKSWMNKNNEPVVLKRFLLPDNCCLRICQNKVLVSNSRFKIVHIDPTYQSYEDLKSLVFPKFHLKSFEVVQDRFLALHDTRFNLREIWELGEGERSKKIASFPKGSGEYKAVNSAFTRLVLQLRKKIVILTFW